MGVWDVILPGPAAAYRYATRPSEESLATYAELKTRWGKLFDWGLKEKEPSTHTQWESWEAFRDAWERGEPDPTGLAAQTADLRNAEEVAHAHGFEAPAEPVRAPDVEDSTAATKAAAKTEETVQAAKEAAQKAGESVVDAAKDVNPLNPLRLPWYVYGIAAGVAALAFGGAILAKKFLTPEIRVNAAGTEEKKKAR